MKDMTASHSRVSPGGWRAVILVINAGLTGIGVWALARPSYTDFIFPWWSAPHLYSLAALVVVPALGVVALFRTRNRALVLTAMIVSAISAVFGVFALTISGSLGLGLSLAYPVTAVVVVPSLTALGLWQTRRSQPARSG